MKFFRICKFDRFRNKAIVGTGKTEADALADMRTKFPEYKDELVIWTYPIQKPETPDTVIIDGRLMIGNFK